MKLKGLGRGLDALLAGDESTKKEVQRSLPVTALQPGKYQPRTQMDKVSLDELAASIRAQGLMQPILVRPVGPDQYEIIAGERRWRGRLGQRRAAARHGGRHDPADRGWLLAVLRSWGRSRPAALTGRR